ncbi:hypothetical protein SELMODRAFT_406213 [Selaginella moellendorffii]|uniref:Uncharacterized protein n=1 Tax=Selaginella moellendorffii TaxID=88036 RepID=D8R1M5_SELML|nr:hypothetical protein SELMODRAFT_406213 [Selaginella moellendorffii]
MEFAAQELHEESTTPQIEKRLNAIVEKKQHARLGAGWGRRFGFTLYNVWWLVIFPVNLVIVAALFSIDVDDLRVNRAELATAMALMNLLAVAAIRDGTALLLLYKIVGRIPWRKYFFNRMLHCNGIVYILLYNAAIAVEHSIKEYIGKLVPLQKHYGWLREVDVGCLQKESVPLLCGCGIRLLDVEKDIVEK